MTPLERASRVLCQQAGRDPDEICLGEGKAVGRTWRGWEAFASDARAVIASVRQPSEAMINAARKEAWASGTSIRQHEIEGIFGAMIDSLLEDGT
jgi:hypothetical protein